VTDIEANAVLSNLAVSWDRPAAFSGF